MQMLISKIFDQLDQTKMHIKIDLCEACKLIDIKEVSK